MKTYEYLCDDCKICNYTEQCKMKEYEFYNEEGVVIINIITKNSIITSYIVFNDNEDIILEK